MTEVRTRTGRIKAAAGGTLPAIAPGSAYADGDQDGMADSWEPANGAVVGIADAWGDADGDGWPNLDEFLDWLMTQRMSGAYPS